MLLASQLGRHLESQACTYATAPGIGDLSSLHSPSAWKAVLTAVDAVMQEDEMLRQAVAKFGDRAWATVANDVPGRSSKSCSDR
jgi:hypothetical protein